MIKRILLLSAYDAESHRSWRENLQAMFADFQWTQMVLPARHFSWRIRGNGLSWGLGDANEIHEQYDLLIATSMVDLASLRGLVPSLSKIPTILYFHENQFEYPLNSSLHQHQMETRLHAQLTSLYSALCADLLVFNSRYNQSTFIAGVQTLLAKLPDFVPVGIVERLQRYEVVAVPLAKQLQEFQSVNSNSKSKPDPATDILKVVWNHRWEYDKGPTLLLEIIEQTCREELSVQFFILGQQFRQAPKEFASIKILLESYSEKHPQLSAEMGYVKNTAEYLTLLSQCDVVLSTALHDFQGLSLLEACALGCTPIAPDRLVYPEYLDRRFLFQHSGSEQEQAGDAVRKFKQWLNLKSSGLPLPAANVEAFSFQTLKEVYLALFESLW